MCACMYVHLTVALPLEATDGSCLLSSQGRRQLGVVLIMLPLQRVVPFALHIYTFEQIYVGRTLTITSTYQIVAFGDLGAGFFVLCVVLGPEHLHPLLCPGASQ